MPENESLLAVVVARLDDLKEDMSQVRKDISDYKKDTVSRGEWVQRNNHVDERFRHTSDSFAGQGREIANLRADVNAKYAAVKTDLDSRRAPWWNVVALITAGAALVLPFITGK